MIQINKHLGEQRQTQDMNFMGSSSKLYHSLFDLLDPKSIICAYLVDLLTKI